RAIKAQSPRRQGGNTMKLITALGTGAPGQSRYDEVTYRWNKQTYTTEFVQEAIVHWLNPKTTCVLLTEGARNSTWNDLRERLERHTVLEEVHIPDGKSEEELWEIFKKISDAVDEGEEIVFDITHGFRSLPMVALLTIAYLKQVKNVSLRHMLYGFRETPNSKDVLVFELTPFADLLDWIAAAKMFIETGSAASLGQLAKEAQQAAYGGKRVSNAKHPKLLHKFGKVLERVSNSLLSVRVPRLSESIKALITIQNHVHCEVAAWAPPLSLMLDKIRATYVPFSENSLRAQAKLIRWYADHNHVVQAMTLAREWIVSYYLAQENKDWKNQNARRRMENELKESSDFLWSDIIDVRNDLAHCGFTRGRKKPHEVDEVYEKSEKIVQEIERLAKKL
ncbi:MAG: TIGR02221 family CRISPR-associated protein, partial [Fimbriimonadales bacterium]